MIKKCQICLKSDPKLIKCSGNKNNCQWLTCEVCIVQWFKTSKRFACPTCKEVRTFEINYSQFPNYEQEEVQEIVPEFDDDIEDDIVRRISDMIKNSDQTRNLHVNTTVHSLLNGLPDDIINVILQEGRVFPPDNFLDNYANWPKDIKDKWAYRTLTMLIDGTDEVVGFEISLKKDEDDEDDENDEDEEDEEDEYSNIQEDNPRILRIFKKIIA